MAKQVWYVLDNVMNLPSRKFLAFTPQFKHDLLRQQFKLMFSLVWLERNPRRRENELMSIVGLNICPLIPQDEIMNFPYFKSKIQENQLNSSEMCNYVVNLINNDPAVMQAVLEEYTPRINVDLTQRYPISDRFSGEDFVPDLFEFIIETSDLKDDEFKKIDESTYVFYDQFYQEIYQNLCENTNFFVIDAY